MGHKAGYINIIGNPNVGKSTLMNALVGEKLSIITSKAQTTRHRIMGIVNGEDFQIVYSDTPGIVQPHYKLHQSMMRFVDDAIKDADIFLYVIESGEKTPNEEVINRINQSGIPVICLLNKVDLSEQALVAKQIESWQTRFPKAEIIPISALHRFNLDRVFDKIMELLPECPPYFPKDELTDRPMRFFISEIIREKILLYYKKEIPYSCEVIIDAFKEEENIVRILSTIYVSRETQKGIILGHNGQAIKRMGTAARKDIEAFLDKKVYLETTVKVSKDWRENDQQLKRFGYQI